MMNSSTKPRVFATVMLILSTWLPIAHAQQATAVNRGVVELETSGSAGISVRIAEDLANLVDDGATRRVVPVVGKGSLQNLLDLKYLRGVDMAILQADVLDYAKEQKLVPTLESSLTYIAKLYNEEFHLMVRHEITEITDLGGRKINVDIRGSGTAITANRLFDLLGIKANFVYDRQEIALEKLQKDEISAIAFVTGKSAPLFSALNGEEGLHFLSIPINENIMNAYIPARLSGADYPRLIPRDRPVDTIAVGNLLAAAELRLVPERNRHVANFVEVFFSGFQTLLAPGHHPKWQEVNLSTEVPGWHRYSAAEQWLQRNQQMVQVPNPDELRAMFLRFVDQRRQATGRNPMTLEQKNDLFELFRAWQTGQAR
jgi:uncharacterized protein